MAFRLHLRARTTSAGARRASGPLLLALVAVLLAAGCSNPASHRRDAQLQLDALADALERGDTAAARAQLSERDSELWDLLPELPLGERAYMVAGLRSARFVREAAETVIFEVTFRASSTSMIQRIVVHFEPGRRGVGF